MFIAGRLVVDRGKVLTLDQKSALEALAEARARMMDAVPDHDWAGRRADEITPTSLTMINDFRHRTGQ